MELLNGFHPREEHPIKPIDYQCAVADVRDLGLTLGRNVLEQLVDRTEKQLRKNGVRVRVGVTSVDNIPFLWRYYLNSDTFVSCFSSEAENNFEDGIILKKIDWASRSVVRVEINSDQIIMMGCLIGEKMTRLLEVSPLHNNFDCDVYTICGSGMYSYTATVADMDPAIGNHTGQIREVTQQVAEVLSIV